MLPHHTRITFPEEDKKAVDSPPHSALFEQSKTLYRPVFKGEEGQLEVYRPIYYFHHP